ncbi:MAG: hypothetical protein WCS52_01290 [bacterium]
MKETMDRRAADNAYFHRDFHGALSCGIEYLHVTYGENAVREYLREFAMTFYAPLRQALQANGLVALKAHFEAIYRQEGGEVQYELSDDELVIRVAACPAVQYMRTQGHPVARLYHETTRTINEALCEGTPFMAELLEYEPQTGRSVQRFSRRLPDEGTRRSHP